MSFTLSSNVSLRVSGSVDGLFFLAGGAIVNNNFLQLHCISNLTWKNNHTQNRNSQLPYCNSDTSRQIYKWKLWPSADRVRCYVICGISVAHLLFWWAMLKLARVTYRKFGNCYCIVWMKNRMINFGAWISQEVQFLKTLLFQFQFCFVL